MSRRPFLILTVIALLLALPMAGLAGAKPGNGKGRGKPVVEPTEQPTEEPTTPAPTASPRVTVAVIDDSTNPYHEFFNTGASSSVTPAVLAEFGIDDSHIIRLTRTGDFEADYAADKAKWDAVKPGEPYWFEGTNIIGITFEPGGRPILPNDDVDGHGVSTSAAVLKANPEAVVVFVEGMGNVDGETWSFNHPAIDIVSTSYGTPGSPPIPFHIENSYKGVVELGKAHFGAADNSPALSPPDSTSGPWWSIGIAGFEEGSSEGRQALSGNLTDFVADFSQDLPGCWNCESGTDMQYGTSFATPRAAGTFSKVLLEARRAAGHSGGIITEGVEAPLMVGGSTPLTTWQLRRALEEAAYIPTMAEYDPEAGVFEDLGGVPINDAAPWAQVAWGVITPDAEHKVIEETLAHAGYGGTPTRTKDDATCSAMTANITARHAYWDNVAIGSESFGTTEDPYIYC